MNSADPLLALLIRERACILQQNSIIPPAYYALLINMSFGIGKIYSFIRDYM